MFLVVSLRNFGLNSVWQAGCYFPRQRCQGGDRMQTQTQDWLALSEAASREQDPDRLIELVQELNRVLWQREVLRRHLVTVNQ